MKHWGIFILMGSFFCVPLHAQMNPFKDSSITTLTSNNKIDGSTDSISVIRIMIQGNKRTKPQIILRDLAIHKADKIAKKDESRAKDVLSFYEGLYECMKQAYKILKPQKYFCIVIGNRLVKQVRLPTDFIIAELGEKIGFTCEDIFVRNIPGKRMPLKTSPTNIVGVLEETMNKESVVILRKKVITYLSPNFEFG